MVFLGKIQVFAVLEGDDLKNAIIPNPSSVTVEGTTLE